MQALINFLAGLLNSAKNALNVQLSGSNIADADSIPVHQTTLISGEDQTNDLLKVEHRYSYKNLAANANTLVKSTPGFLHSLIINKIGASSNIITLYDGTDATGVVIATIDSTIANAPTRIYDIEFTAGLYVAIATGTAPDITISYR